MAFRVACFDGGDTYVVMDEAEGREICVCTNYEGGEDAEERARRIAYALEGIAAIEKLAAAWREQLEKSR